MTQIYEMECLLCNERFTIGNDPNDSENFKLSDLEAQIFCSLLRRPCSPIRGYLCQTWFCIDCTTYVRDRTATFQKRAFARRQMDLLRREVRMYSEEIGQSKIFVEIDASKLQRLQAYEPPPLTNLNDPAQVERRRLYNLRWAIRKEILDILNSNSKGNYVCDEVHKNCPPEKQPVLRYLAQLHQQETTTIEVEPPQSSQQTSTANPPYYFVPTVPIPSPFLASSTAPFGIQTNNQSLTGPQKTILNYLVSETNITTPESLMEVENLQQENNTVVNNTDHTYGMNNTDNIYEMNNINCGMSNSDQAYAINNAIPASPINPDSPIDFPDIPDSSPLYKGNPDSTPNYRGNPDSPLSFPDFPGSPFIFPTLQDSLIDFSDYPPTFTVTEGSLPTVPVISKTASTAPVIREPTLVIPEPSPTAPAIQEHASTAPVIRAAPPTVPEIIQPTPANHFPFPIQRIGPIIYRRPTILETIPDPSVFPPKKVPCRIPASFTEERGASNADTPTLDTADTTPFAVRLPRAQYISPPLTSPLSTTATTMDSEDSEAQIVETVIRGHSASQSQIRKCRAPVYEDFSSDDDLVIERMCVRKPGPLLNPQVELEGITVEAQPMPTVRDSSVFRTPFRVGPSQAHFITLFSNAPIRA